MKYIVPITGFLTLESDNGVIAEKELAHWLFDVLRQNPGRHQDLPDLFSDAQPPLDMVIQIDHNHIYSLPEERYKVKMAEAEMYEKKLAKFLRKKERDQVLSALNKDRLDEEAG